MVKSLKALQDVLGRFQDRQVPVQTIRALRRGRRSSSRTCRARADGRWGCWSTASSRSGAEARAESASGSHAFASKEQRRLVKDTFA